MLILWEKKKKKADISKIKEILVLKGIFSETIYILYIYVRTYVPSPNLV